MDEFTMMLNELAEKEPLALPSFARQFEERWRAVVARMCNRRAGAAICHVVVGSIITNGERWAAITEECASPCGTPGCQCHTQMVDVLNALITLEPVATVMHADFEQRRAMYREHQESMQMAQAPGAPPQEELMPVLIVPDEMGTMLEKVCEQDPGNGYRAIGQLIALIVRGVKKLPQADAGYSLAGIIATIAGELGPQIPVLTKAMLDDTELDHSTRHEVINLLAAVHEHVEPLAQVLGDAEDAHRLAIGYQDHLRAQQ